MLKSPFKNAKFPPFFLSKYTKSPPQMYKKASQKSLPKMPQEKFCHFWVFFCIFEGCFGVSDGKKRWVEILFFRGIFDFFSAILILSHF
jgi:hypothetical protein